MNEPRPETEGYRLSRQQADAVLAERRLGRPLLVRGTRRFERRVELPRLRVALDRLCARHEILRTVYRDVAGLELPLQVVEATPVYRLWESPATAGAASTHDDETPESGVRAVLTVSVTHVGTSSDVCVVAPSSSLDASSMQALLTELDAAYEGRDEADDVLQYVDYSEWQHELVLSEWGEQARSFWAAALRPEALGARLPFEREGASSFSVGSVEMAFDRVSGALEQLTRELGMSRRDALFCAWVAFAARAFGRNDVSVAALVEKEEAELARTLGRFARRVPVPCQLDPQSSVRQSLASIHSRLEECFAWREAFAESALWASGALASLPLGFGYRELPGESDRQSTRVDVDPAELERLQLELLADAAGITLRLVYREDALDRAAAEVWAEQLVIFVCNLARDLDRPLHTVGWLGEAERRRLVTELAGNPRPSEPRFLHDGFQAAARRDPERAAVLHAGSALSYASLQRRANQVAHHLRAQGVRREDVVGVYAGRSRELIVALLGILQAGAAYLPLDPSYPPERLRLMLEDAGVRHVLVHTPAGPGPDLGRAEAISLAEDSPVWRAPSSELPADGHPSQLAYMIYTSGSTGKPKGVMVSHANAVASTRARMSFYDWDLTCFLLLSSVSFDSSVAGIFWTLSLGGTLCLPEDGEHKDASLVAQLIRRAGVTHFLTLPSFYEQLLGELGGSRVRGVIVAGEACPAALARRHFEALPEVALVNEYGPTEGSVWSTAWRLRAGDAGPVPIGGPIESMRVYVLDPALELLPIGATGELFIAGHGITRGYFGRPSLTAERFLPDPHGPPGERMYRTGDHVRFRPDGALEFFGRADQQVKLRGYRIELGEIEGRILEHDEVAEAAVAVRELLPGQGRLVAYVVPAVRAAAGDAEVWRGLEERLRAHLSERLPEFMQPAHWLALATFPQTPNGKLDRAALPVPVREAPSEHVAPRDDIERRLAAIWGQVLSVERVGVHDNFFQLGGDSIVLLQVVALARQQGFALTARDVFGHPSVAQLAAFVSASNLAGPRDEALDREVQLSPAQRWFFAEHPADADAVAQWRVYEPSEALDAERLERCLRQLSEHHDGLRLSFTKHPDGSVRQAHVPAQVLHERWAAVPLLESHTLADEAELGGLVDAARARLRLSEGRLLGALLLTLPAALGGGQRLVLFVHRLVVDAASWQLIAQDLGALYRDGERDRMQLSRRTSSLGAWAEALGRHAARTDYTGELEHWQSHSFDARSESFPRDHEHAEYSTELGRRVSLVEGELLQGLLGSACTTRRAHAAELVLSAFARTLCRHGRKSSVVIGVERPRLDRPLAGLELGRTVGWLASHHPVRLRPQMRGAGASLSSLVHVKEQLASVPGEGLGYGALKYAHEGDATSPLAAAASPRAAFSFQDVRQGSADALLAPSTLDIDIDSAGAPGAWLSLDATLLEGRLVLAWVFQRALYEPATIAQLARSLEAELEEIVTRAAIEPPAAPAPVDFPLARLTAEELSGLALDWTDVEDIFPLSPMQEGMLVHTLLEPGSGIYLMQDHYQIDSVVDAAKLTDAWREVARRHPALRAQFSWQQDGRMLQVIRREPGVPLQLLDHRGLAPAEQQRRLAEELRRERERGFDMASAPLWALRLAQLGEGRYELVISHHHVIMDGWSWGLVWSDVCAVYQDALDGKFPPRATPPTYRDFIAWLSAKDPEEAAGYWRGVLAGFEEATPLPFDRAPAPDASVSRIDAVRSTWSEAETRALSELSTRHGLTTNTFLQAAWALTLSRYSGRRDVLFGVTVAGRPPELPELQRAVGLFINTIPLRVALPDGRTPVSELLKRMLDQNVEMRAHEHLPLVRIQALGAIPKSEPLFNSVLVYENVPLDSSVLPHAQNLKVRAGASRVHTNYPLTVMILPGRELAIDLSFDERFFERATVARLLGELERLLRALIAGFERPLSELPLAPEAERRALLELGRGPVRPMPHEQGYARLLLERARRTPERVAARCMGERLTDAQLDHRSAVVAAGLRARGVALDGRVGVLVERGLDLLTFAVGVLRAGAVYIPLDPSHPPERLLRTLQRAQVRVVLCSPATAALLERANDSNEARAIPMWVPTREPSWSASSAAPSDPLYAGPRSVAYVIHTSGSTGEPKGAMVEHAGMLNNVLGKVTDLGLTDTDVVAQTASAAFDISVWQLLTAPLGGARLEVVPDAIAQDPLALLRHVRETGITVLESVPSLIEAMLAETAEALPSLRWMITTGEAMSPDLARRWRERYPSIGLLNAYGPAECADDVALCRIEDASAARLHLPIGRATDNNRLYVLDANLELVPQGATGELCIAGVGPGRGYLDAPAHTARAFVPNPYAESPGERLYRTGDLVRFEPDGHLAFVGRADHQVKIRGYRVELGEIEARLREHPAVKEGVVVAKSGAQGKVLVAYVVPPENAPALPAEIKEQLSRVLPRYMVPAQIVVLERLPLNANGKLDRKALPEPELAADGAREAHAPPITPLEQTIAEIWGEVLGLSRVGRHDDFFELGGHSLIGVQVISRLRRRTGRDVPLRALFEQSELARFARSVLEASGAERAHEPPLVPVGRDGALPLSFAQQRLWFLWRIEPESGAYHIPVALRVRGALDRALLERCFTALIARHESLRTRFVPSDDGVTQVIDALGSLSIEAFDLSRLEHGERERRARELAAEEAARPFDLVHGPLLRVELVALGSSGGVDEHLLLVTKHHIISDAESMRVLVDEFLALYEAGGDEHAASLPPVPLQYADYAVWQRRWLADGELGRQLDYWKQRLGSEHPPLELPADRPRPAVMSHAGASLPFEIERELAGRLRSFALQRGVTPFMFLLASFQLLLFRYTGQRQIRVGVPNANRNRLEFERCVGFFVNTHVLGAELAPELGFDRLLDRVEDAALGAQAHQDLPFEQLVDALNPQRSLSHSPLFQVMFNHQAAERRPLRPLRDLSIEPFEQGLETSQFDLTLDVVEHDGGIRCVFGYATALFDAWRIEQLAAHFVGIVAQAIEQPQRALGEFQLTTRQQAATSTALAAPATAARFVPVRELIRERARAQPAATALACGERTLSYAELDERADALSRELLRRGAGPDVVIGITAARSLDTLVGMLAILGAGGAYLPLDPAAPPARNQAILADAGVRSVLGSSADLAALSLGPDVSMLALDDAWPATSTAELPRVHEQQLAYVIYTSGSTGRAKGVAVAHGALARHCEAMAARLELDARDRCLHFAAFTFDAAVEQWLGPLLVGAQVSLTDGELWTAERMLLEIGRRGLTRLDVPPLYLVELARHARERGQTLNVRSCTVGGEALPSERLGWLLDALDGAPLYNAYGPTEAVITPLVWRADAARPASAWAPIGTPVGERAALVLDERLEPVPVGVVGELYVAGLLSRGYVGAPASTAASFLPNPFATTAGERMYRTGDLARWRADGSVEYVGRADDQVKLRGFRIEPGEIEAQLLHHPWVRQAAAVARRQEQGHATLVAYVVLDSRAPERAQQPREVSRELQGHLAQRLPSYMVPKVFVTLPALPVLASGKLDRRSLPAPVLEVRDSHVAPRTALETQLGALWAETLQLEVVGVEDNFFELGGDSIRAMQVVDRARARGIELAPRQVFQHQTIAALARAIELEARAPVPRDPSGAASGGEENQ